MQSTAQTFKITPSIKREIVKIIDDRIREAHVTREDFSELKAIVREIAEAQRELAEAQKRTEQRVEELAEAQKRTEQRVEELVEAQRRTEEEVHKLAIGLQMTREELGGVGRTIGYAFENEAYRMLPRLLKERYALELRERIVRAEVGGKEINFFGKAQKDGKLVYVVGEAKTRLDDMKKVEETLEDLAQKIEAVKGEYGDIEVVSLLVTHFATKGALSAIKGKGIILVQSYEW